MIAVKLCDFAAFSCKISLELLFGTARSFVGLMWNPKIGQQTTSTRPGSNDCLLRSRINTLQKQEGDQGTYRWGVYFYTSPVLVVSLFSTLIEALDASLEALNRSNMNLEYCHIPKLCDDFHIILKCSNRNNFLDKKISIIRYSFSTDNDFVIWLCNVYLVFSYFHNY